MGFDKKELKYLVSELKKVFASKPELEALRDVINEDLLEFDPNITYIGDKEPENNNVIWFDNSGLNKEESEIEFDNPIINELLVCIRTLQDQVQQLQADVEYLKIYGGGGSSPDRPSTPDDVKESYLILEDGGMFLMEDGSSFLLESSELVIDKSVFSLEDGGSILLEDGGYMLLEQTI
jgi:hypothetical protein